MDRLHRALHRMRLQCEVGRTFRDGTGRRVHSRGLVGQVWGFKDAIRELQPLRCLMRDRLNLIIFLCASC